MRNKRRRNQRGQTILESALVLIAVISMLLFIIDMGRLLFLQQYFAERARAGARWASVNTYDATSIKNYVAYNSTTGSGTGLFGLSPSNVSVTPLPNSTNPTTIQVTISGYQTIRLIPYIAGSFTSPAVTAVAPVQSLGATN